MQLRSKGYGMPGMKLCMYIDSSAAKAIAGRRGAGKVRSIEIARLWLQNKVRNDEIQLKKTDGKINVADLGTKIMPSREEMVRLLEMLSLLRQWHKQAGQESDALTGE